MEKKMEQTPVLSTHYSDLKVFKIFELQNVCRTCVWFGRNVKCYEKVMPYFTDMVFYISKST